ncbi:MAG: LpxD N-terminal domain-containing protein, partial [Bacteroidales bacterium]
MKLSAKEIAGLVDGHIEGNPEVVVNEVSKIEEGKPGSVSFLANAQYTSYIYDSDASIILVHQQFIPEKPLKPTLIKVKDPYAAFARLLEVYNRVKHQKSGISDNADIAPSAKLGDNVYVGPFVSIGEEVEIGNNTKIYPNTVIFDRVTIGDDCLIFSNVNIYSDCVIGSS